MRRLRQVLSLLFVFMLMIQTAIAAQMPDAETIVLDSNDIAELNVRTIQELLNLIPGVKAGSSTVGIRGDYSVVVILDGMSLINTASAHKSVKWELVSLEDIASIKVIKGGGAVAFGDNSSGGAIIIKTKAVDRTKANLSFEAGNQNYWRAQGNASRKAGPWGIAFNGDFYSTDGFRRNGDKDSGRAVSSCPMLRKPGSAGPVLIQPHRPWR